MFSPKNKRGNMSHDEVSVDLSWYHIIIYVYQINTYTLKLHVACQLFINKVGK